MNKPPELVLRPASTSELNLIRSSWYRSYRPEAPSIIRQDVFSSGQNAVIDRLLHAYPPLVATLPDVPDEVLGWVCREFERPGVVHYVYTKLDFRRIGVAGVLIAGAREYSHRTRAGERLFKKIGALYNPFLLTIPHRS